MIPVKGRVSGGFAELFGKDTESRSQLALSPGSQIHSHKPSGGSTWAKPAAILLTLGSPRKKRPVFPGIQYLGRKGPLCPGDMQTVWQSTPAARGGGSAASAVLGEGISRPGGSGSRAAAGGFAWASGPICTWGSSACLSCHIPVVLR